MKDSLTEIRVLDDFAADAAELFGQWCRSAIAARGVVHVALAGGTTPKAMYEALACPPHRNAICWSSIHFYQGDERPVPPTHPDSNWGMARKALLDHVAIPPRHRHPMPTETGNWEAAAAQYAALLHDQLEVSQTMPVFDLILLGLGTDGHTASLFPDTTALHETKRIVVANPVPQLQTTRLTLTYPAINAARAVWFLVTGASKAELLPQIIYERRPSYPASGVHPDPGCCWWLLDHEANAGLHERRGKSSQRRND